MPFSRNVILILGSLWRSRGYTKGTRAQGSISAESFWPLQRGAPSKIFQKIKSSQIRDGSQRGCLWVHGRAFCQARTVQAGGRHHKHWNPFQRQKKNVIIIIDSMYWLFTGLQLDRGHEGEDSERERRLLHQPRHGQGNRTSCWSPAHRWIYK